jgi:hypothetical protein
MGWHVFLDPDGTQEFGLFAVVAAPTGVTYAHQCAGFATEVREVEGFLVPLGGPSAARPLVDWFARTFGGNPPFHGSPFWDQWTLERVDELAALVAAVPMWRIDRKEGDDRFFLALDRARLHELTEAWVPVRTPYGPGVLVFANCD